MSASHVVDVPRRLRHAAPAPSRSPLISLLAFWMFLQGAIGGLIALLLVVGSGIAGADQSAGAAPLALRLLPLVLLLGLALLPLLIAVGLVRRRRWSLVLLIGYWGLGALNSVLQLVVGLAILPAAGGFAPGTGSSLAGVAFVGAFQLLVIFGLLRHTSEFH